MRDKSIKYWLQQRETSWNIFPHSLNVETPL